jgi:site-specific recombinase XerD
MSKKKRNSPRSASAVERTLDGHVREFSATLAAISYAQTTLHAKGGTIRRFVGWVQRVRLAIVDLDEACLERFLARRHHVRRKMERATLQQFLEYLRSTGVLPPRCASESQPSSCEVLLRKYLAYLNNRRGLCSRSVEVYAPFARAFIEAQKLPERGAALDASAVRVYLLDRSRDRSAPFVKLLAAALRSFLCFLFVDGVTQRDFSMAVPPVRRWRLASVPPFLTSAEVERVIAATDRSTASGCRARAILLLLARLGLRAGEVTALELDDIRWDVGEIVIRGKGRVHDHLPLLHDVGEALALYIREARRPSSSRRVFLRRCAPHVGLSGPTAVCLVARDALRRAGLARAGRVGAHIFRHSLATRMIRHGASLAEIAQVLRHRSLDSTRLYAKVELEALSGIALAWPRAEVQQ